MKASMSPLNFQYDVEDKIDISNAGWNVIGNFSKGSGKENQREADGWLAIYRPFQ